MSKTKFIGFRFEVETVDRVDKAIRNSTYRDRSEFTRAAILEKLYRLDKSRREVNLEEVRTALTLANKIIEMLTLGSKIELIE